MSASGSLRVTGVKDVEDDVGGIDYFVEFTPDTFGLTGAHLNGLTVAVDVVDAGFVGEF